MYKADAWSDDEEETRCHECDKHITFEDYMATGFCPQHADDEMFTVMDREEDEAREYGRMDLEDNGE